MDDSGIFYEWQEWDAGGWTQHNWKSLIQPEPKLYESPAAKEKGSLFLMLPSEVRLLVLEKLCAEEWYTDPKDIVNIRMTCKQLNVEGEISSLRHMRYAYKECADFAMAYEDEIFNLAHVEGSDWGHIQAYGRCDWQAPLSGMDMSKARSIRHISYNRTDTSNMQCETLKFIFPNLKTLITYSTEDEGPKVTGTISKIDWSAGHWPKFVPFHSYEFKRYESIWRYWDEPWPRLPRPATPSNIILVTSYRYHAYSLHGALTRLNEYRNDAFLNHCETEKNRFRTQIMQLMANRQTHQSLWDELAKHLECILSRTVFQEDHILTHQLMQDPSMRLQFPTPTDVLEMVVAGGFMARCAVRSYEPSSNDTWKLVNFAGRPE